MRTTSYAARGRPLAALLFLAALLAFGGTVSVAQSVCVHQAIEWSTDEQAARPGDAPGVAEVTLTIEGLGPARGYPVDCVLIIDTSATADLAAAKAFAFDLIGGFSEDDRVALVSFATTARLETPLTASRAALKTAVGDLATGGKSALGLAMQMARRELLQSGREDAILVEILLADGQSNTGMDPSIEGRVAAEAGIHIVSVGIGNLINRVLLEGFAAQTDGLFYRSPSDAALEGIAQRFEVDVAANEIQLDKRLPQGLRFLSATPKPTQVTAVPTGGTSIVWRISELRIGQAVTIRMMIEAFEAGAWAREGESLLTYADFRGVVGSIPIVAAKWPPIASFALNPANPTTSDLIEFDDRSEAGSGDARIVAWEWEFGDGGRSNERSPVHRYPERGTYEVRLTVVDDSGSTSRPVSAAVTIANTPPVASFVARPNGDGGPAEGLVERPRVGVEILLDASGSYDLDDAIVWYLWDLDADGAVDRTTEGHEALHTFAAPGEQRVSLTVVDRHGAQHTALKTFEVIPTVTTIRTIETGLPDDWTIPAGVVHVTLDLALNTTVYGMSVTETIPVGWAFSLAEADGATVRQSGQTVEWLFLERLGPDGVNARRVIRYTLTAPASLGEMLQGTIAGKLGSSSPRIAQTIGGEDRVTATSVLPVPVVISRWDADEQVIDPFLGETIAFDQIQYAVSLWLSCDAVPNSGNAMITLSMMQDLIAYWLTGSSVHDPLP